MGWPNQQLSFRDLWLHEDLGKLLLRMALNRSDVIAISYFIFATLVKQNELYSIHFKVILVIGEQSGDDDSYAHAQAPFPTTSRPVLPATVCRRSVSLVSINDQWKRGYHQYRMFLRIKGSWVEYFILRVRLYAWRLYSCWIGRLYQALSWFDHTENSIFILQL